MQPGTQRSVQTVEAAGQMPVNVPHEGFSVTALLEGMTPCASGPWRAMIWADLGDALCISLCDQAQFCRLESVLLGHCILSAF